MTVCAGRSDGRLTGRSGRADQRRTRRRFGAQAVVISRIPGASHCALEGRLIGDDRRRQARFPRQNWKFPRSATLWSRRLARGWMPSWKRSLAEGWPP